MRTVLISLMFIAVAATPAAASVPHVVQPGENLWSIAAANNFTTRAFAAATGLSAGWAVIAGTTLKVPRFAEASAAVGGAPVATAASSGASEPMGCYIV